LGREQHSCLSNELTDPLLVQCPNEDQLKSFDL
jgi:hypothetical protein